MTRPGTQYDGPKRLPWPGSLSRQMARRLWDGLEPFFNMKQAEADAKLLPFGPEGMRLYQRMRYLLQELVDGRWRFDGKAVPAVPLALIGACGGRMSWGLRQVVDPLRAASEAPEDMRAQFKFLLGLLALPAVRPGLRQCPTCRKLILYTSPRRPGQRKTSSRRDFCSSPDCKRRDPAGREANARRQRAFRAHRFPK